MKKLIFFCLPFLLNSQNVSIGNWSNYLAYNSASNVVEAENKIYCVANKSLFYVDKYSKLVTRMSKINGLSDVNVSKISYSEKNKTLIVIYENCNIDLITTDEIYNISDIKRKEIIGEKKINNISVIENSAYLSCSFGLVLLDLIKKEIGDTYRIGTNGFFNKINGCAVKQDTIFAATSNGIYFADINSSALFDYNNWNVYKSSSGVYYDVICSEHKLLIDSSSFINSIGFYKDDEHFQILEPIAYLLGINTTLIDDPNRLYWEWRSGVRLRPWFQPYIYYHFISILKLFEINDPFHWALGLRLFNGGLGFIAIIYLFF